jgi:signal transduction histidine kinase
VSRRLLLGFLAFAAIVLALLVIPLGIANQRSERDDLTRRVERDAVAAAGLADELLADSGVASSELRQRLEQRLESYAEKSGARVVVVDAGGTSVLDTGEPGRDVELGRDFSTRPEIAAALDGKVEAGERGSDTLGHPLLFVAVPVASGGRSLGAVRVSYPAEELEERVNAFWLVLLAVSLAVLGVASLVGLILSSWIARPLDSIAQVARDVGGGELDARADPDAGPAEVREVAARLNASLDAVQRMLEDQRRFTADASHQLRTPLHALTLRLDNVAHELEAGDVTTATVDVDKAALEVDRLAALVESLLVLERADRLRAQAPEYVDLRRVVDGRLDAWRERAARGDVRIEAAVPDGLLVRARAVHVEQVLDNYVDNAIAVTPPGQRVRITARRDEQDDAVELHVVDDGPGMSDAELEVAFERFHSGADRPAGRDAGGFGLGLAIVRRLAEVDGAVASLHHAPGHGIDAVVRYRTTPAD